jgi:hypothetical protein
VANIKDESPSLEVAPLHQSTEEIGFYDETVEGHVIEEEPSLTEFGVDDPDFTRKNEAEQDMENVDNYIEMEIPLAVDVNVVREPDVQHDHLAEVAPEMEDRVEISAVPIEGEYYAEVATENEAPDLEDEVVEPEFASHDQERTDVAEDSTKTIHLMPTIVSTEEHTFDEAGQYKAEPSVSDRVFPLFYFIH